MENIPLDDWGTSRQKELEEQMVDLRTLADMFNLKIERETIYMGVRSIVVLNEKGEEVVIGFPDGRKITEDSVYPPAATGKIAGLPMGVYGHGRWMYKIDI